MSLNKLKAPARIALPAWMIIKLIGGIVTLVSQGTVDLTFLNPAVEFGFQSLVFMKSTSAGLAVFIGVVVLTTVGFPLSFLVIPDNRWQNIAGFIAYAALLLTDIVTSALLCINDRIFLISIMISLPMAACLLIYDRMYLIKTADKGSKEAEKTA